MLAAGAGAAPATSTAGSAGACTDPVVHDTYDGFQVGVPEGWHLTSGSGLILVQKAISGATEGVIESAFLGKHQTPASYFAATIRELTSKAKANHNLLSFKLTSPTQATVTGRSGKTAFAGAASGRLVHMHTAHGSRLGVFSAYWAPPGELAGERKALASIGACYGPEQGTIFRIVKDKFFTYALPVGWKVSSEQANDLFLNDGKDGSANYLLEGPFSTSSGIKDAQTFFQASLNDLGIKVKNILLSELTPQVKQSNGAIEQQLVVEFQGTLGSESIQALARVLSETRSGAASGELRIALAKSSQWNALNGALLWSTYGIQQKFAQDEAAILQIQQQLTGFGQQVSGFEQALGGVDIVRNVRTGVEFEAPYNAYRATGPSGPGYYVGKPGKLTKLAIITP